MLLLKDLKIFLSAVCACKLSFIMTFHLHIINISSHKSDGEVAYQQFLQVAEMFHKVFQAF